MLENKLFTEGAYKTSHTFFSCTLVITLIVYYTKQQHKSDRMTKNLYRKKGKEDEIENFFT